VPDVLAAQVTPSDEVRMVPLAPTATSVPPEEQATPVRAVETPEVLVVQVTPSADVIMVPLAPTATRRLPLYTTSFRLLLVPDVLDVHVIPSVEVNR
jgi:hypothetical protein